MPRYKKKNVCILETKSSKPKPKTEVHIYPNIEDIVYLNNISILNTLIPEEKQLFYMSFIDKNEFSSDFMGLDDTGSCKKNKDKIKLKVDTFKQLFLQCRTERCDILRDYYIKLERIFLENFKDHQIKNPMSDIDQSRFKMSKPEIFIYYDGNFQRNT